MSKESEVPEPAPVRTVTFPGGLDPSRVASNDETRWIISHVLIEQGYAIATDGRLLFCGKVGDHLESVPGFLASLPPLLIPRETAAAAVQDTIRNLEPGRLEFRGDTAVISIFHPPEERHLKQSDADPANYPLWANVIPSKTQGRLSIGFNLRLLMKMAKALGSRDRTIRLHLDPEDLESPAFVTANRNDAFGIAMPLRQPIGQVQTSDEILGANHALQHALDRQADLKVAAEAKAAASNDH